LFDLCQKADSDRIRRCCKPEEASHHWPLVADEIIRSQYKETKGLSSTKHNKGLCSYKSQSRRDDVEIHCTSGEADVKVDGWTDCEDDDLVPVDMEIP
jgi:hypothetical protein